MEEYVVEEYCMKQYRMEEFYGSPRFRRVVLGAILNAANECGYRNSRKIELLHWCSEALDNKTMDELEQLYSDYVRNDFK